MSAIRAAVLAVALCATTGCGSDTTAGATTAPATFSSIYEQLFPTTTNPRCSFCHSLKATQVNNGFLQMGSDKDAAHAALVGTVSISAACKGKTLVVEGDPDQSLFLQKVSPVPPCGDRMPLGGAALSEQQLEMIRTWISDGAPNN